jgi:iron complex outermembrane receptor protein
VERGQVSTNTPLVGRDRIFATSIDASLELGWATLRSLTNYHHEKQRFINDLDSSYANILSSNYHQIYEDVSEQLTLTSQRNKNLNWVLGAEYFHGHATDPDFLVNTSVPGVPALSRIGTDALAAYADGTLRLGRFALIAGARYSAERKSDLYQPSTAPKPLIDAHKWFKDFTPRLGGRFAITPQSNIYFTWTKGFKSGNYNGSSSNSIPVRPEKVVAFEGGYKLASSVVRLATSAFYYKYKDIQTSAYDYTTGTSRLINAARAKIYGAEAELNVKVTSELDLRANIAYTHARYQAFPGAIVNVPKPGGTTGNVTKIIDASGNTMIRSPTITISGGANYRKDIEHGYVEASVNAYYSSEVYYTFDNRLKQNPYATVDGSVTWHPDEHFRIGVWGRNLSNANYATFQTATSSRDAAIPAKPRSFGVLAGYRF